MKGIIKLEKFTTNSNGIYISDLDYDKSFSEKGNKKGFFKIVISPIEHEIRYLRNPDGTVSVYGEAWVIAGNKKQIEEKIKDFVDGLKEDIVNYINEQTFRNYEFEYKIGDKYYFCSICKENVIEAKRFFKKLYGYKVINVSEIEFENCI